MERSRKWMFAAAAIACASWSTSAFAEGQQGDKQKSQKSKTQGSEQTQQAEGDQEMQDDSEPFGTTTVTAAPMDQPGAEEPSVRMNMPLIYTGAAAFAAGYVPAAAFGAFSDRDSDRSLLAPLVGPWIALGERDCSGGDAPCSNEGLDKALMITSGVVQGAGVVAVALGLFIKPPERTALPIATAPKVHFTPMSFRAGAGVGAVGTF